MDEGKVLHLLVDVSLKENLDVVLPVAKQFLFETDKEDFYKLRAVRTIDLAQHLTLQVWIRSSFFIRNFCSDILYSSLCLSGVRCLNYARTYGCRG